jgi:hypothetical protein
VVHEEGLPDGCLLCDDQCGTGLEGGGSVGREDLTYAVVRDLKSWSQCSDFTNPVEWVHVDQRLTALPPFAM